MRIRAYMRVAESPRSRPRITVTTKPNGRALTDAGGHELPTVAFAVDFEVPDAMFRQAEQVIATISVPESAATIAADVRVVEPQPVEDGEV